MHLGHPVAQRVEDQPERERVRRVDGVAAAGDVPVGVVGRRARLAVADPVVEVVVQPAEAQRRSGRGRLGRVVVDHVEDHLDARGVQVAHHRLELGHLLAAVARGRVGVVRGEEADRVVAPVVHEAALDHRRLGDELVDRQQLDGRHAEVAQVVDDRGRRHAGVRAAQLLRHPVVERGHPLDVRFVDDGVPPAVTQPLVALPVELVGSQHDPARHVRRGVGAAALVRRVEVVGEDRRVVGHLAADRARERVEQQLVDVEPQPPLGLPRAVGPKAVQRAGRHVRQRSVPDAERLLGQLVPRFGAAVLEQADPDGSRGGCVHREVRRLWRPGGAERMVPPGPDRRAVTEFAPQTGGHRWHSSRCNFGTEERDT